MSLTPKNIVENRVNLPGYILPSVPVNRPPMKAYAVYPVTFSGDFGAWGDGPGDPVDLVLAENLEGALKTFGEKVNHSFPHCLASEVEWSIWSDEEWFSDEEREERGITEGHGAIEPVFGYLFHPIDLPLTR